MPPGDEKPALSWCTQAVCQTMSLREGRSASSGRSRPGPASSRPAAQPTMSGATTGRALRSGGRRARAVAAATSATPLVIAVLPRMPIPNAPHAIAVQASAHAASAPLATRSAAGRPRASALPTTHIQAASAASATTPARLMSAGPARHDVGLGRHDADPTAPGPIATVSRVRRILVTGMSGTGKSTALAELALRGFRVVETDEPGWKELRDGEWVWREDRIA